MKIDYPALIAEMRAAAAVLAHLKVSYGCEYNIPIALDKTITWLGQEADYLETHAPTHEEE